MPSSNVVTHPYGSIAFSCAASVSGKNPRSGREKQIALARRGRRLLGVVEEIYAELEADWEGVVGAERLGALRADVLAALTATYGPDLPSLRPTW